MAKINGGIAANISGSLGDLSIYKMRGVEEPVVRRKSGHTRERVKNDPNMDLVRRVTSEFGGRAKASKYLMHALVFQKPMADHNIAGPLNALMKPVQKLDADNDFSQRNIILSAHAHFLRGFSLNKKHPFDSVVRYPVTATLDRETISARVYFPELLPRISFVPPVNHPYYSLRVSLGVVPDIVYDGSQYATIHRDYAEACASYKDTDWFPLLQGSPAMAVDIQHPHFPPDTNFTLVLAVGIRYGILKDINKIEQAPYVGSAKVLEVG